MREIVHGQVVDGHLGGFVPGGDLNTQYPALWEWLIETLGVKTMLDVGCGDGVTVDFFRERGVDASGLDGIDTGHPHVQVIDFTEHDPRPLGEPPFHDLVWSCEFVEHVEEQHVWRFMPYLAAGQVCLMTHAVPGQGGYHHVNCQTTDYWKGAMAAHGMVLDADLTRTTRALAMDSPGDYPFYHHTGLAFRHV